ncbi:unnamed protein product [Clonostachys rosea f. rosea IK726]|jgi:glutathione S-transferase|uniref:GST N-terminal domain-containing protein n=2 Tax=Bionectria ochroleuca TaxID=29856 RepID=A0A0B7KL29_BIOOC|nr:unnamed protein product [Clonostachys rosea f. rosea IK726]
MSNLVLYRANGACSLAPHIILNELGLPFTSVVQGSSPKSTIPPTVEIDMDEYRRTIHPQGYVPALQVDDVIITENAAVMFYLARQKPERKLDGSSPLEQAQVISWMSFLAGFLQGQAWTPHWAPSRFTTSEDANQLEGISSKAKAKVELGYDLIEQRLKGLFAVGEADTVVDFYLIVFYNWGRNYGVDMSRFPKLGALIARMEQKQSVRDTIKAEGLIMYFD